MVRPLLLLAALASVAPLTSLAADESRLIDLHALSGVQIPPLLRGVPAPLRAMIESQDVISNRTWSDYLGKGWRAYEQAFDRYRSAVSKEDRAFAAWLVRQGYRFLTPERYEALRRRWKEEVEPRPPADRVHALPYRPSERSTPRNYVWGRTGEPFRYASTRAISLREPPRSASPRRPGGFDGWDAKTRKTYEDLGKARDRVARRLEDLEDSARREVEERTRLRLEFAIEELVERQKPGGAPRVRGTVPDRAALDRYRRDRKAIEERYLEAARAGDVEGKRKAVEDLKKLEYPGGPSDQEPPADPPSPSRPVRGEGGNEAPKEDLKIEENPDGTVTLRTPNHVLRMLPYQWKELLKLASFGIGSFAAEKVLEGLLYRRIEGHRLVVSVFDVSNTQHWTKEDREAYEALEGEQVHLIRYGTEEAPARIAELERQKEALSSRYLPLRGFGKYEGFHAIFDRTEVNLYDLHDDQGGLVHLPWHLGEGSGLDTAPKYHLLPEEDQELFKKWLDEDVKCYLVELTGSDARAAEAIHDVLEAERGPR